MGPKIFEINLNYHFSGIFNPRKRKKRGGAGFSGKFRGGPHWFTIELKKQKIFGGGPYLGARGGQFAPLGGGKRKGGKLLLLRGRGRLKNFFGGGKLKRKGESQKKKARRFEKKINWRGP